MLHFNPRLREGGDKMKRPCMMYPRNFNPRLREGGDGTNGETNAEERTEFQSTPPRGRRPYRSRTGYGRPNFNPRLREGGDSPAGCYITFTGNISIHASAREATIPTISSYAYACRFQSTPPRGRRHKHLYNTSFLLYFNPRLREGGDGNPLHRL